MRYLHILPEQVPAGGSALVLFLEANSLRAGILEHGCDGRWHREVPEAARPGEVIAVIRTILTLPSNRATLHVIIEDGAYWPENFPALQRLA